MIKQFLIFLIVIFFSLNANAWWGLGHMVVANIAYQNLNPKARAKVDELVMQFNRVHPQIKSFEDMAVWPDTLYGKQNIYLQFHWHFIGRPLYATRLKTKQKVYSDNAVWALTNIIESYKVNQLDPYERSRLLAFLIHIIGDIHQPLHNVAFISKLHPNGDRGGNDYIIIDQSKKINLHQIWDNGFGLFVGEQSHDHAKIIAATLARTFPADKFTTKVSNLNPNVWSNEGKHNAIKYAYTTAEFKSPSNAYRARGKEIASQQVQLAGLRLANLLNQLLR